jgi:hypothetical protein
MPIKRKPIRKSRSQSNLCHRKSHFKERLDPKQAHEILDSVSSESAASIQERKRGKNWWHIPVTGCYDHILNSARKRSGFEAFLETCG